MSIAYLYIKEYKNIHQQEFNLSSKYNIHYQENTSTLSIDIAPFYIEDFFSNRVSGVHAIIGENGTGKTALLEFILGEVSIGKNNNWRSEFILVVEDSKIIWHHENIPIENSIEGWEVKSFPLTQEEAQSLGANPLNRNLFFYYTNTFDGANREYQSINSQSSNRSFYDLSTNNRFDFYQKSNDEYSHAPELSNYKIREISQQVNFILGWKAEQQRQRDRENNIVDQYSIPFKLPKFIKIEPSKYLTAEYLINAKTDKHSPLIGYEYSDDIHGIHEILTEKNTFKHSLVLSIISGFFNQTPRISVLPGANYKLILEELQAHDLDRPQELIKYIQDFGSTQKKFLQDLIEFLNQNSLFESSGKIILELTPENELLINRILGFVGGIYIQLSTQVFLSWSFSEDDDDDGLSTGEKAWLTVYSRFWMHRNNVNVHGRESIIVLLDEPELGFHPNWQRNLIHELIYFIPVMFGWINYSMDHLNRKIQIIVTSHSPFIISDLPRQNVTFLSRENGLCKVSEGVEMNNTFAANIHTLLSDAFFMNEGLVGEFAKTKINQIFADLYKHKKDAHLNNAEIERIRKIILTTGEPLVAKKLAYLFDEVFQSNLEDEYIDQQIDYWQQLKSKKNSDDSN